MTNDDGRMTNDELRNSFDFMIIISTLVRLSGFVILKIRYCKKYVSNNLLKRLSEAISIIRPSTIDISHSIREEKNGN